MGVPIVFACKLNDINILDFRQMVPVPVILYTPQVVLYISQHSGIAEITAQLGAVLQRDDSITLHKVGVDQPHQLFDGVLFILFALFGAAEFAAAVVPVSVSCNGKQLDL